MVEADRPAGSGPSFALVEWKLRPPSARPGIVARRSLVDRLLGSPVPVVCVVAPPGYGKTTLLAQWSQRRGQRVAWVSIDPRDNDPVVLLTYIAVALDRVEPIDPGLFQLLASPGVSVAGSVVPRLVTAVAGMAGPVAVVLDHLEAVENRASLDAVAELALGLPAGSQLALAARRPPALPVALLRAQGQMVEVGVTELAMDPEEGRALLDATGAGLSDAEVTELVGRTEGWPVGLYLAALARKAGGPRRSAGFAFTGDDRFMADYLRSELLAQLPTELVRFLTRTAVLERLSGPLCDAVLDTSGSRRVLELLEESNLLLVPLDRQRAWYRYHQLFGELLLAELERREPELLSELHGRAAVWCEANGLPEAAIDHAQAAGDHDRVARLVATLAQPAYAAGRGQHGSPMAALVRGPGAGRPLPAGGRARGLAAGAGREAGRRRALGRRRRTRSPGGRGRAGSADTARRQHHGQPPGVAACAVVPRRRRPDVGRRPGGVERAKPGEPLAANGPAAGGHGRALGRPG
jgi:LuxR family maltose regulon positive regulatory protein